MYICMESTSVNYIKLHPSKFIITNFYWGLRNLLSRKRHFRAKNRPPSGPSPYLTRRFYAVKIEYGRL